MLTTEQVELGAALSRIVMAWIAFIITTFVTLFFLAFLVRCVLQKETAAAQVILGVVNIFLLQLSKIMYKSIFQTTK
jgi:hypothetical protein